MKEKKTATSTLGKVLATCSKQAKEYGSCVAAKVPEVERDMCLKEFLALKNCMQNTAGGNMSGKASSSQLNVALGGSGGLSHVYIEHPPLQCSIPGSRGLFYDDANRLLISPTSNQIFSWKTAPFDTNAEPITDPVAEGPILSIRFSLDEKLIAIQRSDSEIQFLHRETRETFSQRCKQESESILGFFWSDCPLCDIVIIKTSGLDLFAFDSASKSLRLVETKRFNLSWYVYTHESRLVLLASGMQCKSFTGFQLSSVGIVRLPRFEMAMAKSEANSKPVLSSEDVHIITVYGRIYCLQVDKVSMLLHSYRFYRDAVIQQGSLPIYSSKLSVSVVDNVLLVHQIDAKVVILYDIFADSRAPLSAPLPLLLRGFPKPETSSRPANKVDEGLKPFNKDGDVVIYGDDWTFLVPDLICDPSNKLLWKIHLDLEAISASCSEVTSVLEFLQRRKLEANKAKQLCLGIARTVILERRPVPMVAQAIDVLLTSFSLSMKTGTYLKGTKAEKTPTSPVPDACGPGSKIEASSSGKTYELEKSMKHESISGISESHHRASNSSASDSEDNSNSIPSRNKVDDVEIRPSSGSGDNPLNGNVSEQQESQISSPAISPDELYKFVFAPIEEEMTGEPSYLISIVIEFLCSASSEKVKVHANLYVMMVQLLACSERNAELGLLILNKVVEPSKEVALQLLESGRQNSQTRKLGLDMLRQLSLHHDYTLFLVQDGYYLEALRYARKHKVTTVRPSLFLEAAFGSNDLQHLSAVLRFFLDFIPGFQDTPDYNTYFRVLSEINSSVVV